MRVSWNINIIYLYIYNSIYVRNAIVCIQLNVLRLVSITYRLYAYQSSFRPSALKHYLERPTWFIFGHSSCCFRQNIVFMIKKKPLITIKLM